MGGHGHGHGPPYKVPDYTIYKVENVPELKALQEKLAKQGLKDPWLRNYVWRFTPKREFYLTALNSFTRGIKIGVPAFLITIAIERALGIDYNHLGSHDSHDSHDAHH